MGEQTHRNVTTGRCYKITTVSKEYAAKNEHARHYIALFERGKSLSDNGWYETNVRRLHKDGKSFINSETI